MKIHKVLSDVGIYILVSPNGKIYVGQSRKLRKRFYEHSRLLRRGKHHNKYLQNSYNKYNGEGFFACVIEYVEDPSKLTETETWWINKFNSFENGFNLTPAADSTGVQRSQEVREKLSEITSKQWEDESFREACYNGRAKYLSDPEVRERMSETIKRVLTERPELRENHSKVMKEISSTPEYKERFLNRMRGWRATKTPEELSDIARKSYLNRGKDADEISKLKAIVTRGKTQSPDTGVMWSRHISRQGKEILSACARWTELDGKVCHKMFSTNKYGLLPAWALAVKFRREVSERLIEESRLKLLDFGIKM